MKSKFQISGIGTMLFLNTLLVLISLFLLKLMLDDPDFSILVIVAIQMAAVFYLFYYIWANLYKISLTDHSLDFKHAFMKKEYSLLYKDLDGFTTEVRTSSFLKFRFIYLKKEGKTVKKIYTLYHKNIQEMQAYLEEKIELLGRETQQKKQPRQPWQP